MRVGVSACSVCGRLWAYDLDAPEDASMLGAWHRAVSRRSDNLSCNGAVRVVDRPDVEAAFRLGGEEAVEGMQVDLVDQRNREVIRRMARADGFVGTVPRKP